MNRLSLENSPYLLQHADNPVDWYPWGTEAIEKAHSEEKPIFLSIGYAACHWCHVMAHESFEDESTAAIMNKYFVNIKVDREERPDLDSIYMNAVVAMNGQGGWPMSVFLTPDGEPFYGGTYFPPIRRYNMPSFREILLTIERLWREDRDKLLESGSQITKHILQSQALIGDRQTLRNDTLDQATLRLAQSYDWNHGGWGSAPKFPQPMTIKYLLRRANQGDQLALDMAIHALKAMSIGGMYDVVGGGFARYSTDNDWLVPHFEKMLYDNALLAGCYLQAYLITGQDQFRLVCEATLDFIIREMTHVDAADGSLSGGFYSSLDADSEGEEGKYYLWTKTEIHEILAQIQSNDLGSGDDHREPGWIELISAAYEISETGNFEGKLILQRALDDEALSQHFGISTARIQELLARIHERMLSARERRTRPMTDDKVLVSWNGLATITFAEAARYLKRPDYLEVARRNLDFLLTELHPKERLLRSWRNGHAQYNAYLEDYAALILALISLYQSDPDTWWFSSAMQLTTDMLTHFRDSQVGFFDTRDDHDSLLYRPKDLQDNATPSGNALAAQALLLMSAYTGNGDWRDRAEAMLEAMQSTIVRYPTAFAEWLCALDIAMSELKEVAILGKPEETEALIDELWSRYRPDLIVAISNVPPDNNAAPLLHDRVLINNQATAYVCKGFVCKRPINSPDELSQLLSDQDA
jgi:hypothetical protein